MVDNTNRRVRALPLHATTNSRFPGWGGLNARPDEHFIQTWEAHDCLNWTNRSGLESSSIGVLATRPGFARDPDYEMSSGNADSASTYGPVRLLDKFYPGVAVEANQYVNQTGQVLRLVQTESGASKTAFQKWNGTAWATISSLSTLKGSAADPLGVDLFPQYIQMGLPLPRFVWGDIVNGIYVYDGSTAAKVNIPKNSNSAQNITGALWLEQIDGRLIVAGNWVDANENNVVYYSAVGDPTDFTSASGGGSFVVYGIDSKTGESAPKRVTGLATINGELAVFTEDMRYLVAGVGTANQRVRTFSGAGALNGKMIVKYADERYGDVLYWWGKDGAFVWNGGTAKRVSDGIWAKRGNLALASTLIRGFSFIYKDQWWTTVRYKRDTITFTGSGTNNMSTEILFTGSADTSYVVKIDATGTPDTFTWSDDGGSTWDAAGVAITGNWQTLNNGVKVRFALTTGHTVNDQWAFTIDKIDVDYPHSDYHYNWVMDLRTGQWYVFDIPMVAAFSSQGGTDVGTLYFACPIDRGANAHHCYSYGVDNGASNNLVYGDDARTSGANRIADNINAVWETGKWEFTSPDMPENLFMKDWHKAQLDILAVTSAGLTSPAYTTGNVAFRLDDLNDTGAYTNMAFNAAATTPYSALNYQGTAGTNNTIGHTIQHRWIHAATKQTRIRKIFVEADTLGVMRNEG